MLYAAIIYNNSIGASILACFAFISNQKDYQQKVFPEITQIAELTQIYVLFCVQKI